MSQARTAFEALSDDRLSGSEIDSIRLLFSEARGLVGVRSPHAGIVAGSMFEPIGRGEAAWIKTSTTGGWTEDVGLRCGPIFVGAPSHEGSGYEIDDRHLAVVRQLAFVERIVREAHRRTPGAVQVLQAVYVEPPVRALVAFDEPGEHGARLSGIVARGMDRMASVARLAEDPAAAWLVRLSARVSSRKRKQADARAVAEISREAGAIVAAASRAWRAARVGVRRG
jgi:hypothetical protein